MCTASFAEKFKGMVKGRNAGAQDNRDASGGTMLPTRSGLANFRKRRGAVLPQMPVLGAIDESGAT